jgi:predicted nucleic acid-binding protein
MRQGMCTLDEALAVIERAASAVSEPARAIPSRAVLELSRDSKCSTYDCEYVALARGLGIPLVTSDRAVLRAFPGIAVSPGDFAAR